MSSLRHVISSFICLNLLCASAIVAQDGGVIRGIVIDEHREPIGEALVHAEPIDGKIRASFVRWVETDGAGNFVIDGLSPGRYGVFAKKVDAGYPDPRLALYSDEDFLMVTITPSDSTAYVSVKLRPKAAFLMGTVNNSENGGPVSSSFRLVRSSSTEKWIITSVSSNYQILIPPSADVLMQVTAPGFKTWSPPAPLNLKSGSRLVLNISLEPLHDPRLQPSRFLVPEGFAGWVLIDCNIASAPIATSDGGFKIFKISSEGVLSTSSLGPEPGADDEYYFYSPGGTLRQIPTDYRNGNGMVWGQHQGTTNGELNQFGFFIGTEEQYKKYQVRMTHPGQINSP